MNSKLNFLVGVALVSLLAFGLYLGRLNVVAKRQREILDSISAPHWAKVDNNGGDVVLILDYRKLGQKNRERRQFRKDDIELVSAIPQLVEIDVSFSNVNDGYLRTIAKNKSVRKIIAIDTHVSDEAVASIHGVAVSK